MSHPPDASPGKILVIRGGALGDFLLTLPVLAALRARFSGRSLEILGYPAVASLAVAAGRAHAVRAIESPDFAGFFIPNGSLPERTSQWFAGFDLIVSYLHDPGKVFQSNVARCTAARYVAGPHKPDEAAGVHAAELLLQPLRALGISGAEARPRLSFAPLPRGRRLALHPGSGSERKNWPEAKWRELLHLLAANTDWEILLISGEAEGGRCARLAQALPPGRTEVAHGLPLIELARRMQSCAGFVGHDSGITHLAAALDLPGLVLWGETVLTTWAPRSERMRIVRHPGGLAGLPVDLVWQEVQLFEWKFGARDSNLAGDD